MADSISLSIPFIVLSTKSNLTGETEKRFLTPFGTIDATFRAALDVEEKKRHLEIEVSLDAEYCAAFNCAISEFRGTLIEFVWGITKDHLIQEFQLGFNKVSVHIIGTDINLMVPYVNIASGEWEVYNQIGHT